VLQAGGQVEELTIKNACLLQVGKINKIELFEYQNGDLCIILA